MKKLSLLSILIFGTLISQAQVGVNTYNDVFIGYSSIPGGNHTRQLNVEGGASISGGTTINGGALIIGGLNLSSTSAARFYGGSEGSDLLIQTHNQEASIFPQFNNSGYLGRAGLQFYEVHAYRFYSSGSLVSSDSRLKENVKNMEMPINDLRRLRGVKYDRKIVDDLSMDEINRRTVLRDSLGNPVGRDEEYYDFLMKRREEMIVTNRNQMGFIAEEVKQILPAAVHYDEGSDTHYVDYSMIIPLLVESMKKQQEQIEDLQLQVRALNDNPGNNR